MDKESIYELQKIDCNCNNCIYMQRNMQRFEKSLNNHYLWQWDYFCSIRNNLIKKAKYWKDRFYDLVKWDFLLTEAEKMKFQFDKSTCMINYGSCNKLNKEVSFIPNTCQLNTQNCFVHRNDFENPELLKI